MPPTSSPEISIEAASQLALFLRKNPDEARRPADELAAEYGLTSAFVQTLLDSFDPGQAPVPTGPKLTLAPLWGAWQRIRRFFGGLTREPIRFVAFTGAVPVSMMIVFGTMSAAGYRWNYMGYSVSQTLMLIASTVAMCLHLGCYFQKGMVRYALQGGLCLWVGFAVPSMIVNWLALANQGAPDSSRWLQMVLVMAGTFIFALAYACVGSFAAVFGGYWQIKKKERIREALTRQEKLERYLILKSKLDSSNTVTEETTWLDRFPFLGALHKYAFLLGPVLALVLAVASHLLTSVVPPVGTTSGESQITGMQALMLVLNTILAVASLLSFVFAGFFARRAWRGVLVSASMIAVKLLFQYFVPNAASDALLGAAKTQLTIISSATLMLITLVSALGATVQRRFARERMLQRNDRNTLLAEMLQLHVELVSEDLHVCVMVVDAAKSSEMKATSDPLVVEYTFRLYQEWIEELSEKHGGRVHSTAGDGAVVAFDTCEEALRAARHIQRDVERFNREKNKLSKPFRLRIGLHTGIIKADLDEVQFTEVIDIAAHVEATSQVGGIAVTQKVAESLAQEVFIPLATEVDGYRVLLVKNPTE
ncbi:MAG: adenylate/guanylate cyclase domain-containing protein [Fimbriimonas sp.]